MRNLTFREKSQPSPEAVLKATSLSYLREALLAQRYEECAELISEARRFGAEQNDISAILAECTGV